MTDHEFEGSLFPVFVTADISSEIVNEIFKRCIEYTAEEDPDHLEGLVLVTQVEGYNPKKPTALPIAAFKSPFIGKSVGDVQHIFEESIVPHDHEEDTPKASSVFAVLDERTAKDKTVLLVSLEGEDVISVRADPEIAALLALSPEVGNHGLDEGWEDDEKDGVILVTEEMYRTMMEEEPDLDEYDDEEEEEK